VLDDAAYGASAHLRLVDRRDRLGMSRQLRSDPVELHGVERGHVDHGHPHVAAAMVQLGEDGLSHADHRVLRPAVGRLQRDPPVRQGRSDLHDVAAVSREHAAQRCPGAIDGAEVGHRRGPLELRGVWRRGTRRTR
jgi:hypothetical protein